VQSDIANAAAAAAAVLALVVSLYTLRRQHAAERSAFITLALTLNRVHELRLLAHTSLENRSPTAKYIDNVLLLVCPADERPEAAYNTLVHGGSDIVKHIRDIGISPPEEMLIDDHRLLAPLHYYTKENSEVADELLTYDAILDIQRLTPGDAYDVRMLLFGPKRLHRVVHRAFIR
jgi:hypothetical protein